MIQLTASHFASMNEELRRLRTLEDKLPRTADGVRVIPPMTAWRCDGLARLARFEINQINPADALVFGGVAYDLDDVAIGFERWTAKCVFSTLENASAESARIKEVFTR